MHIILRLGPIFATVALLVGCVGAPEPSISRYSARTIVERRCGGCHAVGIADASPNPIAPPLRDMFKLYPIDALDAAFQHGLEVGHRDMPRFRLSPNERSAILSYLGSLNPCADPSSDDAAMERCFGPM